MASVARLRSACEVGAISSTALRRLVSRRTAFDSFARRRVAPNRFAPGISTPTVDDSSSKAPSRFARSAVAPSSRAPYRSAPDRSAPSRMLSVKSVRHRRHWGNSRLPTTLD